MVRKNGVVVLYFLSFVIYREPPLPARAVQRLFITSCDDSVFGKLRFCRLCRQRHSDRPPPSTRAFLVSPIIAIHTKTRVLRSQKAPLWREFSKTSPFLSINSSVFDRLSTDGRYAFSSKNAFVWTGPKCTFL